MFSGDHIKKDHSYVYDTKGALSVGMLMINDVYILINYVSFVEALAMGVTVCGLLWLRYKQPDAHRPIKVSRLLRASPVI